MGQPADCSRVAIVVINIIFLVLGLVFFAGGLFIRFGSSVLDNIFKGVLNNLESSLRSSGFGDIDLSGNFSITDLLSGLAIGFIVFGLILVLITLLGCCGGCYKIRPCIILYLVVCVVLLLGEITVVVIFFRFSNVFDNPSKQLLKNSIKSDYQGLNGTNLVSVGWNFVAQQMTCCGVENYDDFTGANGWVVDYTTYTLKTPLACCKTLPDSSDFTCADVNTATDSNNYMNTGCYKKVKDLIFGNVYIVAGALGGIGLIQIVLIIFAVILCTSERRNKVSPRSQSRTKQNGFDRTQDFSKKWASKPDRNNVPRRY